MTKKYLQEWYNQGDITYSAMMESTSKKFDDLTSSYSAEKERIEKYINQAESNRAYTRPRGQIEEEKFETRIEVYPKD